MSVVGSSVSPDGFPEGGAIPSASTQPSPHRNFGDFGLLLSRTMTVILGSGFATTTRTRANALAALLTSILNSGSPAVRQSPVYAFQGGPGRAEDSGQQNLDL